MTAGSGILHSEFNASDSEILKLLQIWFVPNEPGLTPSYEQKKFSHDVKKNKLLKVVSGNKEEGVIFINQGAEIFLSDLDKGKKIKYEMKENRGMYVHLIEGSVDVNGVLLSSGDAVKITGEEKILISAAANSKIVLFDMKMEF